MDSLKKLQDEAVTLANRIDAVRAIEGDDDKIAERDLELETLNKRAGDLSKKIDFEKTVADSAKNLRSVVERCTPAPEVTEERKADRIEAVPFTGKLRAFHKAEDAYRVGMWFKAKGGDAEARRWCQDHGVEARAQGSTGSTTGSSFVPDILSNTVIRLVDQYSAFAQNATNVQMPSDVLLFPRRTGGATAYWIDENVAITASDPTSNQVTLTAKKVTGAVTIANELLADSVVSIADWIAAELGLSLSNAVESAAWSGNPSNAPAVAGLVTTHTGGLLAASAATYAASLVTAAGDTPDEVTKANLLAMMATVPQHSRAGAKWYCSPYFFAACMQNLDLAQGGSVGLSQGIGLTFLGSEVVLTDRLPSATDSTGVIMALYGNLANSSFYGVRQGIEIASSDQVNFLSEQTVIKASARVAINHANLGSSTVAGPMIGLVGA
ncbi:MAG: phage major capsid protein [Actinomycetes bacterium]